MVGKILFSEEEIRQRAREIASEIDRDFAGEEIILLGTLKGAVMWMCDLMKELSLPTKIDFIAASSYGSSTTSSGVVKVTKDVTMDLYRQNVLIVEDIIDTGITLRFLRDYLLDRNPKQLKICTMLDKPSRRKADIQADYTGFAVDDLFIVGYGLDYDQQYRDLPYVSYLEKGLR